MVTYEPKRTDTSDPDTAVNGYNENPQRCCGFLSCRLRRRSTVLPKRELLLLKLHLVVRLVVDVVSDLVLIGSDRGDKVAACPEGAVGEFLGFLLDPR